MNSLLLNLLLLSLFSHFSCFLVLVPVEAEVFLSIDCGSSSLKPYTDDNSIVWVGDDPYIRSGETHKVMIDAPDVEAWDSRVMSSLRAFPTRKKNCYSIDIDKKAQDSTTVERVLVRASFYYGNYDNKLNPPTFNLQFNGNSWSQIITDQDDIIYTEMIYSLNNGNNINICLAQTEPDNIPFISALEVRSVDRSSYHYVDSTYPLFFFERIAFGANTTIRYPEDTYDRIWGPVDTNSRVRSNSLYRNVNIDDAKTLEGLSSELTQLIEVKKSNTSSPPVYMSPKNFDNPPKVLRETHLSSFGNMAHTGVSDPKVPVHYNAFFAEVHRLNATQKRSFYILVNNKLHTSIRPKGAVIPPHRGDIDEVHIFNVTSSATNSSYSIDFVPTNDSTLPPLINALEGYTIGDKLVQGTNSDDVNSLSLLQKSFVQLRDWNGDPCLPSPYTWDWVACNADADSPRITAL
ncbi:probable LRR receptor-like serine/threonine-protein kinase At1g05700 [Papaver somniferum]|uniref:probable LRR receptor-like serine/threonine-protein kinase At1g05700 n=1 Tax=Papaver somniferum TaxID=3469 RepID=UPI000E6FCDDA|nr:probable LRR receptor-like serine/threonine-protein kinase At1g05700 [Papaver somniferum]